VSGVLQPRFESRRRLPTFVGRTWADEVDISANVLAVGERAVTGALGSEAKIVWRQLLVIKRDTRLNIAPLEFNKACRLEGAFPQRDPK